MIHNTFEFIHLIDDYRMYLSNFGIRYNCHGFPVLPRSCFLETEPDMMITHKDRLGSLVTHPENTVICTFTSDDRIYPRFENLLKDIASYRRFAGVVALDLTVTADMDEDWQREIMLANQLYMAAVAVNNVKVIPNLRNGLPMTVDCFEAIPSNVIWASSSLGCDGVHGALDSSFLAKVLAVRPSTLLLYGKRDRTAELQLHTMGIHYRHYDDVHSLYLRSAKRPVCA